MQLGPTNVYALFGLSELIKFTDETRKNNNRVIVIRAVIMGVRIIVEMRIMPNDLRKLKRRE